MFVRNKPLQEYDSELSIPKTEVLIGHRIFRTLRSSANLSLLGVFLKNLIKNFSCCVLILKSEPWDLKLISINYLNDYRTFYYALASVAEYAFDTAMNHLAIAVSIWIAFTNIWNYFNADLRFYKAFYKFWIELNSGANLIENANAIFSYHDRQYSLKLRRLWISYKMNISIMSYFLGLNWWFDRPFSYTFR